MLIYMLGYFGGTYLLGLLFGKYGLVGVDLRGKNPELEKKINKLIWFISPATVPLIILAVTTKILNKFCQVAIPTLEILPTKFYRKEVDAVIDEMKADMRKEGTSTGIEELLQQLIEEAGPGNVKVINLDGSGEDTESAEEMYLQQKMDKFLPKTKKEEDDNDETTTH